MSAAAGGRRAEVTDPFGTAALRASVRAGWAGSLARFREDANTEEDHARGYYRDRVVVELAQNAADAATRAGRPGRLLLRLTMSGGVRTLVAANTGEPLDAAGVASLASLRASAKRPDRGEGLVGRFGVGFAAVRSVSDDITVTSAPGAVRFSVAATRAELAVLAAADPSLAEEVAARGDSLPALRLPFAVDPLPVPEGCTTAVRLVLRDEAAVASIEAQLDAVGDALLLALPALEEIRIERPGAPERVVSGVAERWFSITRGGAVPAELLATRPVEERRSTRWSVTWAVPRSGRSPGEGDGRPGTGRGADGSVDAGVLHAPTPTDVPLTLPALLVASFPLDPSRRHVAPGPVADLVAAAAGAALADLARLVPEPLALVPTGLPAGHVDDAVRAAALEALREAPLLVGRRAGESVMLDVEVSAALVDALAPTGLGVVPVAPRHRLAARALGVGVMSLADVVDALPAGLTPAQWRTLYDVLAVHADDRGVREALSGILVPLADGGVVRGPRGLVVGLQETTSGASPGVLGLRVVHPGASHPLLVRLGAVMADDPDVLGLPGVEAAVRDAGDEHLGERVRPDEGWPAEIAAVLALVGGVVGASSEARNLPVWSGGVPLPADDGRWHRADELAAPGSWAAANLDLPVVDVPDGWSDGAPLAALGVRERLVVRSVEHVTGSAFDGDGSDVDGQPALPGWDDYDAYLTALLGEGQHLVDLRVVEDLDVVLDDSWGAVVDALAEDAAGREALLMPVRGASAPGDRGSDGRPSSGRGDARSGALPVPVGYVAWYLRDVLGAPFLSPVPVEPPSADVGETGPHDPRVREADPSDAGPRAPRSEDGHPLGGDPQAGDGSAGLAAVVAPTPREVAHVRDPQVLAALGAVATPAGLRRVLAAPDPGVWDTFFDELPRAGTPVQVLVARAVWAALERACVAGLELDELPVRIVALVGRVPRVVDVSQGDAPLPVVAGDPAWAQVRAVLPVSSDEAAEVVADVLDLEVADTRAAVVVPGGRERLHRVDDEVRAVVPGLPHSWVEHDSLEVDGVGVAWWVTTDGRVHVCAQGGVDVLRAAAHGCARAAGRWADRHAVELALRTPGRGPAMAAEGAWDAP